MRTPLTYYGGKQRLAPQICEFLPSAPVFIEAFAGGLAVLFERPRAQREVINDLDGRVVAFWRAVRDSIENARVVLSSYPGPELEPLEEAGWHRVDLVASVASSLTRARMGEAPEAIWMNPNVERRADLFSALSGITTQEPRS